ncbi:Tumor necrosis factor receptor superfamily member 8 like [Quillaja saponaria]|uniref:Tumor necrosis factor receptor superfamily member 8 like n=1 Tax=Quillaja saponaria TaxID=32244 RepID=A0AAD7LQC6_QUISA|nr:Tumor necrosis factor receptor superfamily member 8 like [Quillaja saponaria]
MEEKKVAQTVPAQDANPNPQITAQTLPSQPPLSAPSVPLKSKKRPLEDNGHLQRSNYFKLRAVLKDLRPHFIEVIRTPNFRNCKAAHGIQEQLKILMEVYRDMTSDAILLGKSVPEGQSLSGTNRDGKKLQEQPQPDRVSGKPSESKAFPPVTASAFEKQQGEDILGTYVVGGSAFGWNFITFSGKEPVYYGVTKEQFRLGNGSS